MAMVFVVGDPSKWTQAPGRITMCGQAECLSQVSAA